MGISFLFLASGIKAVSVGADATVIVLLPNL